MAVDTSVIELEPVEGIQFAIDCLSRLQRSEIDLVKQFDSLNLKDGHSTN